MEDDNNDGGALTSLNNRPDLDFRQSLLNLPNFDPDNNVYIDANIISTFTDIDMFSQNCKGTDGPIFLNLNIQSLNAKHEKLKDIILRLANKKIFPDVIALQETWQIKYANLLELPGYQKIVYANRNVGRGGGVGFFVKNGVSFKTITPPFRSFVDKTFESLTIELTINM
jgi:hypothetical protein